MTMSSTLAAYVLLGLANPYEEKRRRLMRLAGLKGEKSRIFRSVTGFGKRKKSTRNKKRTKVRKIKAR